jgi:hypothetical protein
VRADADQEAARVPLDGVDDRGAYDRPVLFHIPEHRRLGDPQPDVHGHKDHQEAEQERDPPAPGLQLRVGQQPDQQKGDRAEHQADLHAGLRERGVIAAPLRRRVLGEQGGGAAELGARAEPLDDAQQHEQDRRQHADRIVRGQQSDQAGADAHHQRGDDERGAPADAVAEPAEEEAADRAEQECHAERGERDQRAHPGRGVGEEQLVEDERGGGAVDEEVVPLQGGADQRAGHHATKVAHRGPPGSLSDPAGCCRAGGGRDVAGGRGELDHGHEGPKRVRWNAVPYMTCVTLLAARVLR